MDKNFKLTIEYDGTLYHGWQRQPTHRTIQGEIEKALAIMTGRQVTVIGSGRTDAGVHASGQVANFKSETRLTPGELLRGLNSLLPADIVIHQCVQVASQFHARFDVHSKLYRYRILNRPLPSAMERFYAWWLKAPLNVDAMRSTIPHILGTHDFKSFEGSGSPREHTVRHVLQASLRNDQSDRLIFDIEADGFLRYMVRNLVGTMVAVGLGKITPDQFIKILQARNRSLASSTAPPHGLCLIRVVY